MRRYQLTCEMTVPREIADVFAVFENPYNLTRITPPWLNFQVTSREQVEMRPGAEIDYRLRWLGMPLHWKTVISHYDPPRSFVDEALRSPYVLWRHLHTFEETPQGVRVSDQVDYILPLGPIGRLAHSLAVRRSLLAIFNFRQQTLNELWGGEAVIVPPTVREIATPAVPPGTASPAAHTPAS